VGTEGWRARAASVRVVRHTTCCHGLATAGAALGHVHGITPLRCVGVALDGAGQAQGGPIHGLIPRDVGKAPLSPGDGGFDTPACPA